MVPSPEFLHFALLAGLVSASFAAVYMLRRQSMAGTEGAAAQSARAIRSARRAVSLSDPENGPRRAARARMQLAMLLTEAGGRDFDPSALHEAVELLDTIIPVFDAEGLTPEWASAVYFRGRAEWGLGMLQPGTSGLEQSVATFRHLLELENWPRHLLRPVVVSLPAVVLADIGQRRNESARLEEGLALAREAAASARTRIPVERAITHRNLAHCLALLGCERSDAALLEEAISSARTAVAATRRNRYPGVWTASQASLAHALAELGVLTSSAVLLREAVGTYDLAEELSDATAVLEGRVNLSQGTGYALLALGRLTRDPATLADGVRRLEQAVADFRRTKLNYAQAETARMLGLAHASMAEIGGNIEAAARSTHWYGEAQRIFLSEGALRHAEEVAELAAGRPASGGFVPGYQVK